MALAKAQAAPPADYHIRTAKEIADEQQKKKRRTMLSHPELALWKNIKTQLTGADGAGYFGSSMKDALVADAQGKSCEAGT